MNNGYFLTVRFPFVIVVDLLHFTTVKICSLYIEFKNVLTFHQLKCASYISFLSSFPLNFDVDARLPESPEASNGCPIKKEKSLGKRKDLSGAVQPFFF